MKLIIKPALILLIIAFAIFSYIPVNTVMVMLKTKDISKILELKSFLILITCLVLSILILFLIVKQLQYAAALSIILVFTVLTALIILALMNNTYKDLLTSVWSTIYAVYNFIAVKQ